MMFVLPAVILAFIVSFPTIYVLYSIVLGENLGYMPSVVPSGWATLNALFLGLIIPLFSSIIPIKRGLATNLTETLDVTRSKNKGALITIIDGKMLNTLPYLLYGSIAVSLGITVYYGLPVALL